MQVVSKRHRAVIGFLIVLGAGMLGALAISLSGNSQSADSSSDVASVDHAEENLSVVMRDPNKITMMECMGVKIYENQPPPSMAQCAQILPHSAPAQTDTEVAPQLTVLDIYKVGLKPAEKNVALARVASLCGLRDQEWFDSFVQAFNDLAAEKAEALKISDADRAAADVDVKRNIYGAMPTPADCQSFANSPVLPELDEVEAQMSATHS